MLKHSEVMRAPHDPSGEAATTVPGLAGSLRTLGDPTRLRMLGLLVEGPRCNCEIAELLGLSLSLVSHHLRTLQRVGLVHGQRDPGDARWIHYSIDRQVLAQLRAEVSQLLDPSRIRPRPSHGEQPNCGSERPWGPVP